MLRLSLQSRIFIFVGFLLSTVIAVAIAATIIFVQIDKEKELELRAKRTADLQASALVMPLWQLDREAEKTLLLALQVDKDLIYASVQNEDTSHHTEIGQKPATDEDVVRVLEDIIYSNAQETVKLGTLELVFSKASLAQVRQTFFVSGFFAFLVILGILLFGIYFAQRYFTTPLTRLTKVMNRLAEGELETEIPALKQANEIGEMARAVSVFKKNSKDNIAHQKDAIQQRVQKEAEIRRAMVEKQANEEKSKFLANMSHELRTPLNAILGFANLMRDSKKQPISGKQKRFTDRIISSGQHLLQLINDILDLSRIESGNIICSIECVEVSTLFQECFELVMPLASAHDVFINFEKPEDDFCILCDFTRTKQILLNLCTNAIKYNKEKGSVIIRAEAHAGRVSMVRIIVEDTGIGIAEDKQDKVFAPFERLGAEMGAVEGTGIGMTITKKLVHLMKGEISFTSVEGEGSVFYVDLPRTQKNNLAPEADGLSQKKDFRTKEVITLLYFEDNPMNMELMADIVEDAGNFNFLSAHTAEAGLPLARKHRPDIIIMDLNLPGMSGFNALETLKGWEETKNIPVIALSANASPRDIKKGLAAGFVSYITKPLRNDQIMDEIYRYL